MRRTLSGRLSNRTNAWFGLLALMFILPALSWASSETATAGPSSPTDVTKVPHYFGPYPNWANSPLAAPDATVTIVGDGSGARAAAQVGARGAITGLELVSPGSGYTHATVQISGAGSGAAAVAIVQSAGSVTAVALKAAGAGYVDPAVAISGGGATTAATVHALGGVGKATLNDLGKGYTFPTVDFDLPDDPNGVQASGHVVCVEANCRPKTSGGTVTITSIVIDQPGSGYTTAPGVSILDGTPFSPATRPQGSTFSPAAAKATLTLQTFVVDDPGSGYTAAPTVVVADRAGSGTGAAGTAVTNTGAVTALNLSSSGSGYLSAGGIKKFVDTLPGLGPSAANNLGQYVPVAQPDTATFPNADFYTIAVVQHRERMSSSLAKGTLLRVYVQLSTKAVPGKHVALRTDLLDGSTTPVLMPDGSQAYGVDDPHYMGPVILATRDRAVRVVFYNLLPTGANGDLFLPTDSTVMGSGMGPMKMTSPTNKDSVTDAVRNPVCTQAPKSTNCFKDNRATLHLHGGVTPWISDGTPHQWITPATENTSWPRGVSVAEVPDMIGANKPAGVPDCSAARSGCQTFYYTNQQSARLLFYHDHSFGITRLNVYAGEEAAYLITDPTEKKLIADGTIPSAQIPLVIQDRTFVPDPAQVKRQDPTWDYTRWGSAGDLWYHHVYMPAQNPNDPSGSSAFGRWMYGPYFWPPAVPKYGVIDNPYFDSKCDLDKPATWQYQSDPFCEPAKIPGTPNISAGMEQFNDTPVVNGTAYPTTTLDPKAYRLRILNGANDRFWNLQWYVADPTTGTNSEVALKAAEVAEAQTDTSVAPTPDTNLSPAGPPWIQIGSDGGFLPKPVVVPNQPVTYITDATRFDFGNVDQHALLLGPAERADVIVDFSKYAGKTLILYNDAPAAFPARVPCYDYYTGDPDMSPACAPSTLPGYGPNTRTIMQVKVAATTPSPAFNLAALRSAFKHHADGSGVFESDQHPIIVGQAPYNTAYGTKFAASGDCSGKTKPAKCDGYARIRQQGGDAFTFDTLKGPKLAVALQPKAIHDEMNSADFDEYGRMTANLGVEAAPATPLGQTVTLYPYINPQTELIDGTDLPVGDSVQPISSGADGTQIWKITHNGVDTHPIHFHLYDVQVINRVTWDGIIMPPDPAELGWKDTVLVSPLEDTIIALRPVIPKLPWEIPNSIRPLNPTMPLGDTTGFNSVDPNGNATNAIKNELVNFGWEYVFHCHILSHEEMDMMRPVSVVLPPRAPDSLVVTVVRLSKNGAAGTARLDWNDNSIADTAYVVERRPGPTGGWRTVSTIQIPLDKPNTTGPMSFSDSSWTPGKNYEYRVLALNTVGYGAGFPSMTARSFTAAAGPSVPAAPVITTATATRQGNAEQVTLSWDKVTGATAYTVQWSASAQFTSVAGSATSVTGTTYTTGNVNRQTWYFRVMATATGGSSPASAVRQVASA